MGIAVVVDLQLALHLLTALLLHWHHLPCISVATRDAPYLLLTMSLHLAIAMQLVCGVTGIFTNTGMPGKLGWGQLSEFRVRYHAAAYAAEKWYCLHQ